jgi:CRISPR-associated endonuclease/helicase Cas3
MTSLEHHTGRPKVEPWLRGWIEQIPQARILWRRVLPIRSGKPDVQLLNEFFDTFPPHLTEVLETETYRVVAILKARQEAVSKLPENTTLAAVVLDERGKVLDAHELSDLKNVKEEALAGKTVVLHAALGGLSSDGLLDSGAGDMPITLDGSAEAEIPSDWERQVGLRLRIVRQDEDTEEGWVREAGWPVALKEGNEPSDEWRIERLAVSVAAGDAARARTAQALQEHLDAAAEEADGITGALGLDETFRHMLRVAAASHDMGKDRDLWQTAMGARIDGRPFAKTDGRRADGKALGGYRQEFGSLRDAEERLWQIADEGIRDLARHLYRGAPWLGEAGDFALGSGGSSLARDRTFAGCRAALCQIAARVGRVRIGVVGEPASRGGLGCVGSSVA